MTKRYALLLGIALVLPRGADADPIPWNTVIGIEVSKLTDHGYAWDSFVWKHGLDNLVMGSEFPLRHIEETRWAARRV